MKISNECGGKCGERAVLSMNEPQSLPLRHFYKIKFCKNAPCALIREANQQGANIPRRQITNSLYFSTPQNVNHQQPSSAILSHQIPITTNSGVKLVLKKHPRGGTCVDGAGSLPGGE